MKSWTEERKQKQREVINRNKPWLKSTGPKTRKGKARASLNSLKHGGRARSSRSALEVLRLNREFLKHIELYYMQNALEMRITSELIKSRLKSTEGPTPVKI